jgi:hypothetical protein
VVLPFAELVESSEYITHVVAHLFEIDEAGYPKWMISVPTHVQLQCEQSSEANRYPLRNLSLFRGHETPHRPGTTDGNNHRSPPVESPIVVYSVQ